MSFIAVTIKPKITYFLLLVLFFRVCAIFLLSFSKPDGFTLLHNLPHNRVLNFVFTIITSFGNGVLIVSICALLFFIKKTKIIGLQLFFVYIISGFFAQILKRINHLPRPKEYFNLNNIKIDLPDAHLGFSSMPSGHTTTAFALTTLLCIILANKKFQIPLFILAVLVGYSRIYLGHHFLEDVLAGSIIGTLSAFLTVFIFNKTNVKNKLNKSS